MITLFPESIAAPKTFLHSVKSLFGQVAPEADGLFAPIAAVLRTRHETAVRIGMIAPTGADLIEAWDACLQQGREPMILHYPTAKLSRIYWNEEIVNAIRTVGLDLLICADPGCVPDVDIPVILLSDTPRSGTIDLGRPIPEEGAILQMSSGTTGFKKGIRYTLADIRKHVLEYNKVLNLTAADRIVSWLPLYHDMGYIAAFIMPRMLDVDLVLIDPMTWVRTPSLLSDAIERFGATLCYMPNFGFEVMSRAMPEGARRSMPSMRLWISCSEPTRAETMRRFMEATGAPETTLANCWGMAENIFAVAQSEGLNVQAIDGVDVVSCGRPIPGTEVKTVDGEVYVRSDYSLQGYIGTDLALDRDGFYPTGDMGVIVDGEIYLQGRKKDIINNGGRKTLLSDLDFIVGETYRAAAGRIAAIAHFDPVVGTEVPVILIEDERFWEKNRDQALNRKVLENTGIELARAYFVPPKFISKTSSGKINRRLTGRNWALTQAAPSTETGSAHAGAIRAEIERLFPWLALDRAIGQQLDSLGFVNLSLVFAKYGLRLADGERSVDEVLDSTAVEALHETRVLRIVSLTDGGIFKSMGIEPLKQFAETAGIHVQFHHVCAPPAKILLSDLIFHDQFLPREGKDQEKRKEFEVAIGLIKSASIILTDDASQLLWPLEGMIYPMMDHGFQSSEDADLLCVRWALYSCSLDRLPVKLTSGAETDPTEFARSLDALQSYLNVPFVRIAYEARTELTKHWEIHGTGDSRKICFRGDGSGTDYQKFSRDLKQALSIAYAQAPLRIGSPETFFDVSDQNHWCSWLVNRAMVDFIVDRYENFVVHGKESSVPYLNKRVREKAKRLQYRPDLHVPDDCDCVIQIGSWGKPDTDKPIFQVMAAGWAPEPAANVSPEILADLPPSRV